MNIEDIALYLDKQDVGTIGKSIFVNDMPASCKDGILLLGSYAGTLINHEMPNYFITEFRIVIRSVDYSVGFALANKVSKVLTSHTGFTTGNMLVRQCLPINTPRSYRRSVGSFWEFEVDVQVVFVDLST